MNLLSSLARVPYHQLTNGVRLLRQEPVLVPSLGSMTLDKDDVELANAWLRQEDRWYDRGPVSEYESAFATWNGSACAVSFMSARVALSAAINALGLGPGDEVVLPGYTCVVVPNAFAYAGVKPIYSDIELDTYGLDATRLAQRITPRTRAILLHHLYGLVCRDYEAILEIARGRGLYVIEDCAQSTGAEHKGKKVGNNGDIAIYSSEQSKVFNTVQGGVAVTNDASLASRLLEYRDRALLPNRQRIRRQLHTLIANYWRYKHPARWWVGDLVTLWYRRDILVSTTREEVQGVRPADYGQSMPAPIAAVALNQLKKIDAYNRRRRSTATRWDEWCEATGRAKPIVQEGSVPVFLRYPVLVEPPLKRHLSWALAELGVEPGVWFVSNTHPAQRPVPDCPNADLAVQRCINLPTLLA